MGEEFQGAVCGGNTWWNTSRTLFGSSPCLTSINDMCSFDMLTARPADDLVGSNSAPDSYAPLPDALSSSSGMNSQAWNQDLINSNGKSEENYSGLNSSMNFCEDFQTNSSLSNNQDFPLDQNSMSENSTQCAGYQMNSPAYSYNPSLLHTLFETDSQPQMLDHNQSMNYSSGENCAMVHEFSPILPKSSPMKFTNNTPFWNAKANIRPPLFSPSTCTQPQFVPPSMDSNSKLHHISNFTRKHQNEETGKVAKKSVTEPAMKRARIETPSPLPTFKVRKEKLGDRVTALQQLVSPFGKTDTASVLHEAIEYIKFLHDQVSVLSTPYLKNGSSSTPKQCQLQATGHKTKTEEHDSKQDLRSRGLCLVPIASTFPVATESSSDFWTPAFGGSFR